jgi:hypothetical protein
VRGGRAWVEGGECAVVVGSGEKWKGGECVSLCTLQQRRTLHVKRQRYSGHRQKK